MAREAPPHEIVTVTDRPDLVPTLARWMQETFGNPSGRTLAETEALFRAPPRGPEESFVLLLDGQPVGTASLAHDDLETRRDLSPWLAGVVVQPQFRGRGFASALVRRVERFAAASGVQTLWLYTWTADALYAQLGWEYAGQEFEPKRGIEVTLMRRTLREG
ncbi:GNAT family N-acetyltransferase [Roseococcus sp. MDT2-1-1]|uniref:GNAT family N-acetyltransferase n=2 Tax=Sabulicella glaciei TaxID=2984948 RepID=A0ABT3NTV6_9PROT|nr:GNAT family N-acetyltransferase [Roseococcus sp. MDT2-1-1]